MNGTSIENTVKFRFPTSAPRPSWTEIASFVKQLNSDITEMDTVYKMGEDRSLCIKYKSASGMQNALSKNTDPIKFLYSNGKSVEVRMSTAGMNAHYVRVFDIPPEVPDSELSNVLGSFGKIERVVREKFPPNLGLDQMFTGVRGVFIDVEKEIPSSVDVLQWKGKIYYDELRNKCFLCQMEGHRKSSCPQREVQSKRGETKRVGTQDGSYAGVVIGTTSVDQGTIEILEEEVIEELQLPVVAESSQPSVAEEERKVEEPVVYRSENERILAENWKRSEEERRKRQEEYRKNEKSMQRRYQEGVQAREKEQRDHWEKCEAERKSRQEKYSRDLSAQRKAQLAKEQVQSPPKKTFRKQ